MQSYVFRVLVGGIVFAGEPSSANGLCAKDREHAVSHIEDIDLLWFAGAGDVDRIVTPQTNVLEGVADFTESEVGAASGIELLQALQAGGFPDETLNMAVLAPIPTARVMRVMTENIGARARLRNMGFM